MPSRRVLRGVLHNFLGTYASRYSEYDGYWLFGFLVKDLSVTEFDLLATNVDNPTTPAEVARCLASTRFMEQLSTVGLDRSHLSDARLVIERFPDDRSAPGQHYRAGYNVRLLVIVKAGFHHRFECERIVFAAPHDARLEQRSARFR